ncbi:glycosyltransferase [Hymenobacter sp. UV11]|nr:glycosyltransferase [Hymenobacter sp. UV11]
MSVIMPVYNAQQFLAEAIDSILLQSFTNFEFIIIDDCSGDCSPSIVQSYDDPRIRFYRNEQNLGISHTLNRAISLASSDLIARMDADDRSHPQRLQIQYDYLQAHPACAMVSCFVKVIAEDGTFIRQDAFDNAFYYYNLTFICWIYHSTVVYRKQAVQQVGLYTVPYSEDFELFWQLSRRFIIANLSTVLLDYRETKQSLHQTIRKQEYLQAQQEQVLRNIRYYTSDSFPIKESHIQCLQHNFQPLLAEQSVKSIMKALEKLNFISHCIAARSNINLDRSAIEDAAAHKKAFIVSFYAKNLSKSKGIWLLIRLKSFRLILWEFLHI